MFLPDLKPMLDKLGENNTQLSELVSLIKILNSNVERQNELLLNRCTDCCCKPTPWSGGPR